MTAPFVRAATLTKNLNLEKQRLEIGPRDFEVRAVCEATD